MGFESTCDCFPCCFGRGVDGDYSQNGGVVTIIGMREYANVLLEGGAVFGPQDTRFALIYAQALLKLVGNSILQARFESGGSGGASRNTIGAGNGGGSIGMLTGSYLIHRTGGSGCGAPGGGGGAVNPGGNSGVHIRGGALYGNLDYNNIAGGVGPGPNGTTSATPACLADFDYEDRAPYTGISSSGAGSGGVDSIGTGATTGTSGKGGNGGKAGGLLHVRACEIEIEAGSSINADGEDGQDGDDATDSTNLDADCGGGGGGGGGSAGGVFIFCRYIDNPALVTAIGGTGGAGGAPVGGGGAGGIGGNGANGIVANKRLAA